MKTSAKHLGLAAVGP